MKFLLLMPHHLDPGHAQAVSAGEIPESDVDALVAALGGSASSEVKVLDFNALAGAGPFVRLITFLLGRCWGLAALAVSLGKQYDAVFSHAENVGVPFALLLKLRPRRPRHVMIGNYLHGRRNALWFRWLRVYRQIDTIFTNAPVQYQIAREDLNIPANRLSLTERYGILDQRYFTQPPLMAPDGHQVCAVGLEFRDYATLVAAVAELPDIRLKIDCASPWSTHANRLSGDNLPANVEICRNAFGKLREFYAQSAIVAIPLLPNDISAGLTTLLEAMAMGKAVVMTQTAGHKGLVHGDTVLLVPPLDVGAWRDAIVSLIRNPALRDRLGRNAREWVARHASREAWVNEVVGALQPISAPLGFEPRPLLRLGQTPHGNQ